MKKIMAILLIMTLAVTMTIPVVAADKIYEITDKKILQNFETGDPLAGQLLGSSEWGGHWIDATHSVVAGLEGNVAYRLDFGTSEGGTLSGLASDNIGANDPENDWSMGQGLLYRIKNLSDSAIHVAGAVDVLDHGKEYGGNSRYRSWPANDAQVLLDLDYKPAPTTYAKALAWDGETWSDLDMYVIVPAGFDGYILSDFSKFVEDIDEPFEVVPMVRSNPNWLEEVRQWIFLVQECQGKSIILDDFRIVNFALVDIPQNVESNDEPAVQEAANDGGAAVEEAAAVTTPAKTSSPSTGDGATVLFILLLMGIAAGAFALQRAINIKTNSAR